MSPTTRRSIFAPRDQIEDAERRLYELAETGRYDGGFQRFATALTTAVDMAATRLSARRQAVRARHRPDRHRPHDGRAAGSDLIILAGRPGMGKTALATNLAYNIAQAWRGEVRPDGRTERVDGGIVGFFSLEMSAEQLATRIISEQTEIPSYRIRRGEIDPARLRPHRAGRARDGGDAALHRRDRRPLDRAARRPRAPAQAPARPRPAGDRLHPAAVRLEPPRATRAACRR